MDMRQLTPDYFVSPQISAEDFAVAKEAGIVRVICNRPDAEIPPHLHHAELAKAAEAAGIEFEVLELTHQTMTPENVAHQHQLIADASGPVLAYCASGTRCSVVWALGAVKDLGVDMVLAQAQQAGYQLEGLRPSLEQIESKPV